MEEVVGNEYAVIDLSVIVPVWNAADTLGQQLAALAGTQSEVRFEIVIADNGSTDASLSIVETYRDRFPVMRIVDASDRRGAAHARNVGAAAARGRYLAFADADDVVGEHWIEAIARALDDHPVVASRFEGARLNEPDVLSWRSCPQQDGLIEFRYAPFLPFAGACGLGIRKDVFTSLGGFDTSLLNGEDIDFSWRAQIAGWDLHFEASAVMHIRMRSEPGTLYRQTRGYGFWTVPLYARYRDRGMPRVPWTTGPRRWLRLLRRLPHLARRSTRRRWLRDAAYAIGLLQGSVHFHTLAL